MGGAPLPILSCLGLAPQQPQTKPSPYREIQHFWARLADTEQLAASVGAGQQGRGTPVGGAVFMF